jgi:hypothetical protein
LVLDAITPPPISIKGVHWAKKISKWACRVGGCDASYITKYNLLQHLRLCHNVVMEAGKLEHPFTWEKGPRHQNHAAMNAQVLNNPMAQFYHNGKR